ncbi:MAG: ABC transporter ATP-binding protein [Oscillatoriophycideae cyanobacterium NC_groundwater_1537_Pr4_S-0.65um_50_18]|nr:ABC transporter ATP-binding protein [Oscillatoriophycideae cyanobacterium NC_groundwater_1537_Pr4_S-0.65um_50_18]
MARVYLEDISRRFGSTIAIADITFEVPDGEFWVLVGPSGCGKSTILRTIAGLDNATSGSLFIGDRRVNQVPARERDVAMVFQNYALYPHMTVAENLAFGLRMRQAEPKTIRARVETVAQSLNIAHLLDRKPRQLSGGQQQRVALGRAIARQPQVFLLDEPLSNLDAQLRDDTRAELKQLHQRLGITTIYVTHDQVEAMTLADRIVVLHQGKIQQIADPQTMYAQPANQMVATFLGNPPMNILPVTYDGEGFQLAGRMIPCPERLRSSLSPGQRLNLGIRPEHIQIAADRPAHLVVEVAIVEPLGRETLLRTHSIAPEAALVNVQVAAEMRLKVGDRLPLFCTPERLVLFDPATGNNLNPA